MSTEGNRRLGGRGFTLLEVMVAVAILGIVLALLVRAAVGGMAVEGDAHRRLAASLIADRLLAEVESQALLGTLPELGRTEDEEGGYQLAVETRPLELSRLGLAEPRDPALGAPTGLLGVGGSTSPPLLEVEVSVQWKEGVHTQEVRRTTFSFDAASVAEQLPSQAEEDGPGELE